MEISIEELSQQELSTGRLGVSVVHMLKEKGKSIHEYNVGKNELIALPKGFDDVVDQFNGKAFRAQLQDGIGYVICRDRKLLEKLLKDRQFSVRKLAVFPRGDIYFQILQPQMD